MACLVGRPEMLDRDDPLVAHRADDLQHPRLELLEHLALVGRVVAVAEDTVGCVDHVGVDRVGT